jgi:hypothetical protein
VRAVPARLGIGKGNAMKHTGYVWLVLMVVTIIAAALPASVHAEGGTWPPVGQLAGGEPRGVAVQGDYAYVGAGLAMTVIDVSTRESPRQVGSYETGAFDVASIAVAGSYAYVPGARFRVVDISDPAEPAEIGSCDTLGGDVALGDGYAYLGAGEFGIRVIDISNPTHPVEVGSCDTAGLAYGVAVSGGYAYVADKNVGLEVDSALRVIDVSDPAHPVEVGACSSVWYSFNAIAVQGAYAYVADQDAMRVFDVSDPAHPHEVGAKPGFAWDVVVAGTYVYVVDGVRLEVIDVSDPVHPVQLGQTSLERAMSVAVSSGHAYVAGESGGFRVVDVSAPALPAEVGCWNTPAHIEDFAAAGAYLYAADAHDSLVVVDASTPSQPVEVCRRYHLAWDICVSDTRAYVLAWESNANPSRLRVLSLADPAQPAQVGWWAPAEPGVSMDALAASGSYVYLTAFANDPGAGLRVLDASNPALPVQVGFCLLQATAKTLTVAGGYAYAADWRGVLRVIDVSDPGSPFEAAHYETPDWAQDVAVADSYAYVAASGAGLRVIDVSNPANPVEAGYCDTPGSACGVAVAGRYAYVADGYAGLRVIDVANPALPVEVAYWDTPGSAQQVAVGNGRVYLADWHWGLLVFPEASPAVLSGQVRVQGTATNIEGATVEARSGGQLKGSATTDAKGIYRIPGLMPGAYSIAAVKPGYTSQTKAAVGNLAQTAYVNFNLAASGRLMGQVTDRVSGTPLIGATVTARSGGVLRGTATTVPPWGIYEIDTALPAGTYSLNASKTGYTHQSKLGVGITEGATTYVNFRLAPPPRLKGQVKDKVSGAPIIGATVQAYLSGVLRGSGTTIAPWGVYEIDSDLPAGTYLVATSAPGYATQGKGNVTVTADATAYVNFRLQPQ